jgi:acylphosphatase
MTQDLRHAIIRGRVQGVGYRVWVEDEALRRGLAGWTRNRRDGSVEAVFAGAPEAVAAMIEACRGCGRARREPGRSCGAPRGRKILVVADGVNDETQTQICLRGFLRRIMGGDVAGLAPGVRARARADKGTRV